MFFRFKKIQEKDWLESRCICSLVYAESLYTAHNKYEVILAHGMTGRAENIQASSSKEFKHRKGDLRGHLFFTVHIISGRYRLGTEKP